MCADQNIVYSRAHTYTLAYTPQIKRRKVNLINQHRQNSGKLWKCMPSASVPTAKPPDLFFAHYKKKSRRKIMKISWIILRRRAILSRTYLSSISDNIRVLSLVCTKKFRPIHIMSSSSHGNISSSGTATAPPRRHRYTRSSTSSVTQLLSDSCNSLLQRFRRIPSEKPAEKRLTTAR